MPDDVLIPFPVSILLLLHYLTAGVFGLFWIVTMHGRLPRVRPNDLSGGLAAALLFVPVFNLYWIFHVTERLCDRLNELRRYHGLTGQVSEAFAVLIALLLTLPVVCWSVALVLRFALSDFNNAYLAMVVVPAGLTVLVVFAIFPAFAAIAQGSFNEIGRLQITRLREQVRSMNLLEV